MELKLVALFVETQFIREIYEFWRVLVSKYGIFWSKCEYYQNVRLFTVIYQFSLVSNLETINKIHHKVSDPGIDLNWDL